MQVIEYANVDADTTYILTADVSINGDKKPTVSVDGTSN